jgi:hypothetical protein
LDGKEQKREQKFEEEQVKGKSFVRFILSEYKQPRVDTRKLGKEKIRGEAESC